LFTNISPAFFAVFSSLFPHDREEPCHRRFAVHHLKWTDYVAGNIPRGMKIPASYVRNPIARAARAPERQHRKERRSVRSLLGNIRQAIDQSRKSGSARGGKPDIPEQSRSAALRQRAGYSITPPISSRWRFHREMNRADKALITNYKVEPLKSQRDGN